MVKNHSMAEESVPSYKLSTVFNSVTSSGSYNFTGMDKLVKMVDNFQSAPAEVISQKIFVNFMNKIAIWDYCGMTRDAYLACSDSDKVYKINKYYFDMKSRSSSGKRTFFSGKMSANLAGIIESRDSILSKIEQAVTYVSGNCFYFNGCWQCYVTSRLQKEANRKGLKTFNKHIKWWTIVWTTDKDPLPILKIA